MAYQAFNLSTMSEVPGLVGTFAASQGFTVDLTNPNQPIIQHPTYAQAKPVKFSYVEAAPSGTTGSSTTNCYKRLLMAFVDTSITTAAAVTEAPRLWNGASNLPNFPPATKLHLFSSLTPQPYIAGVIEYGYNLYRHFYFGYAEKSSSYEGGEIITGSAVGAMASSSPTFNTQYTRPDAVVFPFGAASQYWSNADAAFNNGGIRVVHANNPTTWRKFIRSGTDTSSLSNWLKSQPVGTVFGGFRDGVNTGYMRAGKSVFAGQNILVPINLYLGNKDGTVQAIGRPAGVRLVNMANLDPGAEITIGSSVWRVFPIFAKSALLYLNSRNDPAASAGASWPAAETSFLAGQAYLVSDD